MIKETETKIEEKDLPQIKSKQPQKERKKKNIFSAQSSEGSGKT